MKPYVSSLVKGGIPLQDALDKTYKAMFNNSDSAKLQVLAELKTNNDATYTTSNTVSGSGTSLTQTEINKINKFNFGSAEEKERFIAMLKETRK